MEIMYNYIILLLVSQCNYETFKKIIKYVFNFDPSMVDLNAIYKSFLENNSFYLVDLLIEIIIAMQGTFSQKLYLLYDLLLLYQPSPTNNGLYFDTVINFILTIYNNMHIPLSYFNLIPTHESKFLKARIYE